MLRWKRAMLDGLGRMEDALREQRVMQDSLPEQLAAVNGRLDGLEQTLALLREGGAMEDISHGIANIMSFDGREKRDG